MELTKTLAGNVLTVAVNGKIDTLTAPQLDAQVQPDCAAAHELVLDLAQVEYVSSAGLRILLRLHKLMAAKGGMRLLHTRPEVYEVFEITGFNDIFTFVG